MIWLYLLIGFVTMLGIGRWLKNIGAFKGLNHDDEIGGLLIAAVLAVVFWPLVFLGFLTYLGVFHEWKKKEDVQQD